MSAGHDTRAAAQADCDRANRAPLKGVTLAPRRCGACNGVGHTRQSERCPAHPKCPCFACGVRQGVHDGADHRFRAGPLVGELVASIRAAEVKP
jgi:hypothetical protein